MTDRVSNLSTTMTIREYAEYRGVSEEAVRKQARKGRLVLTDDRRVKVVATDALLEKVLHPTKGGRGGSRATAQEPAAVAASSNPPPVSGAAAAGNQVSLTDAARLEKIRRVALLDMDIAERCGQLVDRETVERQAFARSRQALDALMAIADRISMQLAAESDPHRVHVMLDAELRRVAQQIAEAATPPAMPAQPQPESA